MTDLTPQDVRNKRGRFHRTVRGYDTGEVDAFLNAVAHRLTALANERDSLLERTRRLEERLDEMEDRDRTVQETLLFAQRVSEQTIERSQKDAEAIRNHARHEVALMRAEAEAQIARRLEEVEGSLQDRKEALEELEKVRVLFLRSFKKLLEREITTVEVEAARKPLEGITLGLELQEWIPSAETPVDAEPRPEDLVPGEEGEQELLGSWAEPEREGEGEEAVSDRPEIGPDEASEAEGRKMGAFDFIVTSVKEEALEDLISQVLDDNPQDRPDRTRTVRAEETEEEDT
jgi:cell division initiation protein